MLDNGTKQRIDTARNILVGKVPDPKSQVEQITIALIYKFMDDMDQESLSLGGTASFFVGEYEKYGWTRMFDPRLGGFDMLALYAEAITRMSENPHIPQLFRDIFKNAYLPYRDPETLKLFLKTINEFHYDHSERLGDAFEYLLSVLGSQGDAGQFRTPRHIIEFMVAVVNPQKHETILDPACGTAGFLISAYKHIRKQNTIKDPGDQLSMQDRTRMVNNFTGYDISPDMVRLSLVNMYLHGFVTPQIYEYDTLSSEDRWHEYADVILANPPFMSPKGGIRPHKKFSVQSKRSEVLFVDYMAEHLTPNGRAAIIVPEGIIFQSGTAYKDLRKYLVEKHFLWAVVSLPSGVFNPYAGVKTSILFLDKVVARKTDRVLFVKVENDGFDLGAQRRPIDKNDLPAAQQLMQDWQQSVVEKGGEGFDLAQYAEIPALLVEKSRLAENGEYNLTGDRYKTTTKRERNLFPIVELKVVCEIISGQSPEGRFYNDEGIGTPFYQGKTEFSEIYIKAPTKWTTQVTKTAYKNDILMSVRAPVGPVNIASQEICIGRGLAAIRANEEKILHKYLFYLIRAKETEINGNSGAVFPSINRSEIEKIKIPLPPLEIQREIVTEIGDYQRIINGARMVVENWKPNIELELEEARKEAGVEEWEMVKLGEVCENLDSLRKPVTKSDRKNGIYPYYGASGIIDYVNDYLLDGDFLLISEDGANLLARNTPIAFSITGKTWVNNHAHVLKFENKVSQHYVELLINSMDISLYVTGSAQPKLNQKSLNSILIPFPPYEIQERIVNQIQIEEELILANKKFICIYNKKIFQTIDRVWNR
ncbi:MAG: N-6 DNA methylase [Chloroflexi bacterium HGW-Chloroflexi-3]|nr:MAG: N-6 DNA methylase [Chloroflexi bacterium HGW-Chloroflexi-3]